ncbi:MAG: tetratricopeptide repeat protein, partial [Myxococcota bacterium]
ATQYADKEKAKLRQQKIKLFKQVIPTLDAKEEPIRKAQLMYQLAEEYWEESKYLRFQAMEKHNIAMEQWDKDCRRRQNSSKCPKAPKPKLQAANKFRQKAIGVYEDLLKTFPKYQRADEVLYTLGFNYIEDKKAPKGLQAFQKLIQNYSRSRFIPDAYTALGDHYFNTKTKSGTAQNLQAIKNYRAALKVSLERIQQTQDLERKITLRGTHLRALYMFAWCALRVGEYDKSLKHLQEVIRRSLRYQKTKESKVLLHDEALRDLVRVYARLNASENAYTYFRSIMGPKYAYQAVKRLASRYYNQGNYEYSIKTYRFLMTLNPAGQPDNNGPEVPRFQNEVLRSVAKIKVDTPKDIYKEV